MNNKYKPIHDHIEDMCKSLGISTTKNGISNYLICESAFEAYEKQVRKDERQATLRNFKEAIKIINQDE